MHGVRSSARRALAARLRRPAQAARGAHKYGLSSHLGRCCVVQRLSGGLQLGWHSYRTVDGPQAMDEAQHVNMFDEDESCEAFEKEFQEWVAREEEYLVAALEIDDIGDYLPSLYTVPSGRNAVLYNSKQLADVNLALEAAQKVQELGYHQLGSGNLETLQVAHGCTSSSTNGPHALSHEQMQEEDADVFQFLRPALAMLAIPVVAFIYVITTGGAAVL